MRLDLERLGRLVFEPVRQHVAGVDDEIDVTSGRMHGGKRRVEEREVGVLAEAGHGLVRRGDEPGLPAVDVQREKGGRHSRRGEGVEMDVGHMQEAARGVFGRGMVRRDCGREDCQQRDKPACPAPATNACRRRHLGRRLRGCQQIFTCLKSFNVQMSSLVVPLS